MTLYSCSAVEELIGMYNDVNGEIIELEEGTLGYGLLVCMAEGYKTAIVTEVPYNEMESGHKIRFYNELPEKYDKMIVEKEKQELGEEEYYKQQSEKLGKFLGKKLMGKQQVF